MGSNKLAKTLVMVLILTFCPHLQGQSKNGAIIQGKVLGQNKNPIPYAQIFIKSLGLGTVSESNGAYRLEKVPLGTHEITFSYLGYTTRKLILEISATKIYKVNIELSEGSQNLDEVVVKGKSKATKIEETGFNVEAIDIAQFQNTTLDVNQILGQKSGVRIRETGGLGSDFNFFLNGLSGRQVKFFLDGQPLENFGSVFNLNNIPSNLIERVDVYKGAVPIQLGADALGGAINLITRQDLQDYLDISFSYGSFNTSRANISGRWRAPNSGFTAGAQAFYNYSDNNYIMRNVETISNGQFVTGDFERFHDGFRSYLGNLELGFSNVPWADSFILGFAYGELDKDVQTSSRGSLTADGALSLPSYGEAVQEEESLRYTLKYQKRDLLAKGLDANIFLSYNRLKSINIDTTSNRYNWEGRIIAVSDLSGELNFEKTFFVFDQNLFLGNVGLEYELNDKHQLSTNFTWTYLERQGENTFLTDSEDPFREPNTLDKKVLGVAYRLRVFDKKLETTLSGKYFGLGILAREARTFARGETTVAELTTNKDFFGYGLASRYSFHDGLQIKTSYERAFRIPEAFEIFGDGLLILANPNIVPESSHNINLGANWKLEFGNYDELQIQANGFYRLVDDIIFPVPGGIFVAYDNIQNILIRGVEGELRYRSNIGFQTGINVTYQDVLNNVEFLPGTSTPNIVFRQRLFNTPFLFGNADASYRVKEIGQKKWNLDFTYSVNFVEEFFLNFPNIALGGDKFTIPRQLIHNAGIALSSVNGRYNLSLEVRNLTDEIAFDNFALQKPGRAIFFKLRYFLTQ